MDFIILHNRCRSGRLSRSSASLTSGRSLRRYSSRTKNLVSESRPGPMLACRIRCSISARLPSSGAGRIMGLEKLESRASSERESSRGKSIYFSPEVETLTRE